MTKEEISDVVNQVLTGHFPGSPFLSADVELDEDFDGASIIRVTAHYDDRPKTGDDLVDSIHALRSALLAKGEDRFIFLTNDIANERQVETDLD